jgi:hypothetical protein
MVSPLHADGTPWDDADYVDGVAIARAEEAKRDTYPELVASSRCRLVVLACETGGRWSDTCSALLRALAAKKAEDAPPLLRGAARQAWVARWYALLSVAQQTALAATLAEDVPSTLDGVVGEPPPLAEVLLND